MKPSAKEYSQAHDRGATARRNGRPITENPWANAATEHDLILRDQFDDGWHQENNRRRA